MLLAIFQPFAPPAVILPGLPSLRITRLGGVDVPYPPMGQFGPIDVTIPATGVRVLELAATGIPVGTTVQASVKPEMRAGHCRYVYECATQRHDR